MEERIKVLIDQKKLVTLLYTLVFACIGLYVAQAFSEKLGAIRSAASRGALDLSDAGENQSVFMGTFFNYYLNDTLKSYGTLAIICILTLTAVFLSKERKVVTATGLSAFPYTRAERFTVHFLSGLTAIIVGTLPLLIFVVKLYFDHTGWITERNNLMSSYKVLNQYHNFGMVMVTLLLLLMSLVISYLVILLTVGFMGRLMYSVLFGYLLLQMPLFIIESLSAFTGNAVLETIRNYLCLSRLFEHTIVHVPVSGSKYEMIISMIPYTPIKIIYAAVVLFVLIKVVYHVFRKKEITHIGLLFSSPKTYNWFIPIVTICLGFAGTYFAVVFLESNVVFAAALSVLGVAAGYGSSMALRIQDKR